MRSDRPCVNVLMVARPLARDRVRAYSHGWVRVGDALGLVAALLSPQSGWDRGHTEDADRPPCGSHPGLCDLFYHRADGVSGARFFPDIYRRDTGAKAPTEDGRCTR